VGIHEVYLHVDLVECRSVTAIDSGWAHYKLLIGTCPTVYVCVYDEAPGLLGPRSYAGDNTQLCFFIKTLNQGIFVRIVQ